jgi:thymidylate synthase
MYLWLKDVYSDLELGIYYHNVDNIHFYEKHFEIADNILKERTLKIPTLLNIQSPLFYIKNNKVEYTELFNLINNETQYNIDNNLNTQENCCNILKKYKIIEECN